MVIPIYNEKNRCAPLRTLCVTQPTKHRKSGLFKSSSSMMEAPTVLGRSSPRWQRKTAISRVSGSGAISVSRRLDIGVREAKTEIIITMDADLQDDPSEIPNFLSKLEEGYDLVSGWKQVRKDRMNKVLPSKVFNYVTARLTGVRLRDMNCGFKAYRREVFDSIVLYGELHRYVPVLADSAGFRIGEIPVKHHPRRFGASKYGFKRYARGFLDLLTTLMITRFDQRPGHLFGGVGLLSSAAGLAILTYLSVLKRWERPSVTVR